MGQTSRKKDSNFSVAIVVAIVLVASALLLLRPAPEQVMALSEDGRVWVEGVTRESGTVLIERIDGVDTAIEGALSPVYELTLTSNGTLQDGELTFAFAEFAQEGQVIQEVVIYQFDRSSLSWKSLSTFFDLETQTLFAPLSLSGSLLVGLGERVQDE